MQEIELPFVADLKRHLRPKDALIQVVMGPRQVGKTTGVKQLIESYGDGACRYVAADGPTIRAADWLRGHWLEAVSDRRVRMLIVDEVQNIEGWSGLVKQLWDRQGNAKRRLKIVILGSSSLNIQRGLEESLAGRFFVHRVHHWSFEESRAGYGLNFEQYLTFGGYPGSYRYLRDRHGWLQYMRTSIIDTVVGKDILNLTRVKSPALFRQCFDILSAYPAQEVSYTKLLGQLQDRGNTDLVKTYIGYFEGAFLFRQLFKHSNRTVLARSSSPKILPLCPALYSVGLDGELGGEERDRAFELAVGMQLMRLPGHTSYWRVRNAEVDYVYRFGKRLVAIEVKSGRKRLGTGLSKFEASFPGTETYVVTPGNFDDLPRHLAS